MVTINYRDGRPIYEQVKDDLRRLVVTGAMQPGEKLPSVRELAVSLAINPNTIQRAYHELESEGYIVSVPGKGQLLRPVLPAERPAARGASRAAGGNGARASLARRERGRDHRKDRRRRPWRALN